MWFSKVIARMMWAAILSLASFSATVFAETTPAPIFIKSFPVHADKIKSPLEKHAPPKTSEAAVVIEVKQPPVQKNVAAAKQSIPEELKKTLQDADALLQSGKPLQAYKLLAPLDFKYSGIVVFDYLLGVAALDSAYPDKATLAFERVLTVDPNFAGARLDMARAYFQLGDLSRAKVELQMVMKQAPPEAARLIIQKYLDAIESAVQAKKTRYSGYVEASFGRDSNVNNSTSQAVIAVPAFGNLEFTLSPTNLKTPSYYASTSAGGDVNHRFTDKWGVYGGLDLRTRANEHRVLAYDSSSIDTRLGISFATKENAFRLGATYGLYDQAHIKNRNAYGLTTDWRHNFDAKNQSNMFGQFGRNRFSDSAMQINDFDQSVVGVGLLHILGDEKTALFGNLNWARENAVNDRADGNKTGYGLRLGVQSTVRKYLELFANVGYQTGRYDKQNLAFLTSRNDAQYDVSLGSNWHWNKYWTVRPQFAYSNNKSNIAIYSFDRIDVSLSVRRDFK